MVVPNDQKELFTERFNAYMDEARQQYAQTDPNMTSTVDDAQASAFMKTDETGRDLQLRRELPVHADLYLRPHRL